VLKRIAQKLKGYVRQRLEPLRQHYTRPVGDSFWWEGPNLWEPSVQLALRDLCRPGSVVYDVGANFGGLTAVMSRAVGPRGIVCSFEASPRVFPHLQLNVVKQGFNNVTVYNRAVFSRTGESVQIYPGDHLNDSIYDQGQAKGEKPFFVQTLSLDDFCSHSTLVPDLIKVDVEGAEFDVLSGSEALISSRRPHFLLEQQPQDPRCLNFLSDKGYIAIDLNTYRIVRSAADYPSGVRLRNTLFVHQARTHEIPYGNPPATDALSEFIRKDFRNTARGLVSRSVTLPAGRYLVDMKFEGSGTAQLICGVRSGDTPLSRYHGASRLLANSYRDWVFDLQHQADVEIFFMFPGDVHDDSLRVGGGDLRRLIGFVPTAQKSVLLP